MATVVPPPSKRQKRETLARTQTQQDVDAVTPGLEGSFKARFVDGDGQQLAEVIEVPLADASEKNLTLLLNTLLGKEREDFLPYKFRIHIPDSDTIIETYPSNLLETLRANGVANPFETTITLSAEPQAVFKVQAVTRMAHKIPGHGEAILAAQFSPETSKRLATGSGDKTARIWDTETGTPKHTLAGHAGWVLCVAWSPDGRRLATGSMDKTVRLWDPDKGVPASQQALTGHAKWVTNIAWEPYHLWRDGTPRLASASKDATVRVWIVNTGRTEHVLSGHKSSVSCVKWGGTGLIYTASHDKTVKVWDAVKGTLVHTLSSHAHWVNHLALSTEFALRTGFFDHTPTPDTEDARRAKAKERFEKAARVQGKVAERLVSASDDFTMYLWDPSAGTKPVARMLGHQKQVNQPQMTANHHLHDDEKVDDVERAAGTTTSSSDSISSNNEVTANPPASAAKAEAEASTPEAGPTAGETKQDAPEGTTTTTGPPADADADVPEAGRTKLETTLIVLSLCAALFLAALDVTIITTAVPTIAQEFNSNIGYIWIGSAYLLANAAFVPTWGKISDIWGRKPVLLSAVGVFWVGSLLCGLAVDMAMLIAARAIQGIGGGGIIVLVNICISDLFSMRQRGVYFGVMGMVWAVASAVGPVIGGVFTSQVTWRWCFYINLPISGVGIIILFFVLKLHNPRTPVVKGLKAIDWIGTVTIIGGTIMFLFGLEFGGVTYPWSSPTVICLIVFGILTIGLFTVNEWKYARYPVIPMHLFSDWSNLAAFATAFCHAFAFISGSYWLPLYFQGVQGVSSLLSGVYLLPYVLSLSLMSALAGYVIRKTGNYLYLIIAGMAVATLGFGLFHDLPLQRNFTKIVLYQIVAGLGIGPNFQSPLIAVQTSVEPRDIAAATSTFGFIRQMATSISVVIGGVVFNNEMQKQHPRLLAELGPELAGLLSGSSAASSVGVVAGLQGEQGQIARGAYLNSLRTMYIVYVAFAGLGLVMSLFIRQKQLSKKHTEHRTGLKTLRSRTGK